MFVPVMVQDGDGSVCSDEGFPLNISTTDDMTRSPHALHATSTAMTGDGSRMEEPLSAGMCSPRRELPDLSRDPTEVTASGSGMVPLGGSSLICPPVVRH